MKSASHFGDLDEISRNALALIPAFVFQPFPHPSCRDSPCALPRRIIMNISVIDGSNYFKGLLLLVRKDLKVSEPEIEMMNRIGKKLGFEQEFCENAIHDVLENTYIVDSPPGFSNKDLAARFIRDGLALALSDREVVHPSEEEWLRLTVEKNGLDPEWFRQECVKASNRKELPLKLQVDDLKVVYSRKGSKKKVGRRKRLY